MAEEHTPVASPTSIEVITLQCIIEAKDREIQQLRERLISGHQPQTEEQTEMSSELQRLRDALRARAAAEQPAATPSMAGGIGWTGGTGAPAFRTHGLAAASTVAPVPPAPVPAPSPPAGAAVLDPDTLVEKLRGLVTGLVAEALAAQQQQQPQAAAPDGPQHRPAAAASGHTPQPHDSPSGPSSSQRRGAPQLRAGQPTGAEPVAAPLASPSYAAAATGGASSGAGAPAHPLAPPPQQADPHGNGAYLRDAAGSDAAAAAAAMRPSAGGGASAPAVLVLNVDGKVLLCDRRVLETQAAGSRLHELVVRQYGRLPLDSQGRPYLSYNPRIFEVLLSLLKSRWLFGSAAFTPDWPHLVRSLRVPQANLEQTAAHFGLLEEVTAGLRAAPAGLPSAQERPAAASVVDSPAAGGQ
ncbi:hypothetical protein TSOC_006220 [Tetrabaena socialis]|uniref:Potassium channel tetramerisation-type BTB domain-containing protein n=1 Tax=Tetrabaena socialis TaxID=47790 RepID=A0A2J8A495_9CHLO|nr:hypothetical protein TSOC_006220 [Tetrabaena socialis]|eukprot:PNH07327.1 hypothetical protein TSOC_006220 [Tetrabaena socialis]